MTIRERKMFVINRKEYDELLLSSKICLENKNSIIDIYNKNNWDQFVKEWDTERRNETPSYIDFFFDAKNMVDFLTSWIHNMDFKVSYIAPVYRCKYKLKIIDNDVCKDVYDEMKKLLNSLSLKVSTNKAIAMNKDELLLWLSRISIGGFTNVSDYVIFIPNKEIVIQPHHHMNYLIYCKNTNEVMSEVKKYTISDIITAMI